MSSTKENELQPYQQLLDKTEKPPMLSLPKMFYVAGTESQRQIGFVGFFFPINTMAPIPHSPSVFEGWHGFRSAKEHEKEGAASLGCAGVVCSDLSEPHS